METGVSPSTSYTIGGVKVEFPCKAYPTQLSMMSMIVKGIERRQNCLLESPTGSGKSLALLCSCLAWQRNEYKKRDMESMEQMDCNETEFKENVCTCDCGKTPAPTSAKSCTATSPPESLPVENNMQPPGSTNGGGQPLTSNENCCNQDVKQSSRKSVGTEDEDDQDFQPSKKRYRTPGTSEGTCKKIRGAKGVVFDELTDDDSSPDPKTNPPTEAHWQMQLKTASVCEDTTKTSCPCSCHDAKKKDQDGKAKEPYIRRKVPRIYFGTRTHKQITQIVRELGRTVYKDVPMCILGSREYTCVHPTVSKGYNKNEGCKELLEGKNGRSCRYYNGAHKMKNQWQLRDHGLTQAWDIEDLVTLGKKIRSCPYFAVRSLKDEADIVFCPYNYLVDPMIRMTMDINMKNQIVVLDEAHNIEDSARDAASCSVTTEQLEDTVTELDHHITQQWRESHCRVIHSVTAALLGWVKSHSSNLPHRDFERALRVWSGTEIVGVLSGLAVTKDTLATFQHHLAALLEDAEPLKKEQENGVMLSSTAGMTLKGLFLIFEFLFKDDSKYMRDFKVAIVRTLAKGNRHQSTENRWISKRRSSDQTWTMSLNFWCLNPAVAFTDFGQDVRTIVLTSGTLSPMSSFQSELGVAFPIQLEANHVVHPSQVWVGTVAMGTKGGSLNGSYKNAETYSFQDEIGLLLLEVCQVIPYGVLCFLPSYGMMSKLTQRWKNTGLWEELEKVKIVMSEARGADKVNFDEHLREFYEVIKDAESTDIENQSVTGALFLAVCRGKVSEGMDFADNNARAVLTVGIPFPNIRDTQVELKRQYNDQYSASRGLLSGSEWYEIQAYRAINQALGRCIRHKRDWGALILVDDRYGRNPKKYITGLSKWVRSKVVHYTHAQNALTSLDEFAKTRQASPCPELPSSVSMCASPSPSEILNTTIPLPATPGPSIHQFLGHKDSWMPNGQPAPFGPSAAAFTSKYLSNSASSSSAGLIYSCDIPGTITQMPVAQPMSNTGPKTRMLPQQGDTTVCPSPAVASCEPLRGKLVEEVDQTGRKIVKLLFTSPSKKAKPQVDNTPVSHGSPSQETGIKAGAEQSQNASSARRLDPAVLSPQDATQSAADSIKTPKGKLDFDSGTGDQLAGRPVKTGPKSLDLGPPKFKDSSMDLMIDDEQQSARTCPRTPLPAEARETIQQMEEHRAQNDTTPLLFDSEDTELEKNSPLLKIAAKRGRQDVDNRPSQPGVNNNNVDDTCRIRTHKQALSSERDATSEANMMDAVSCLKGMPNQTEGPDAAEEDEGCGQTKSGCPKVLRRSSRKQKTPCRKSGETRGEGDLLDVIDAESTKKAKKAGNFLCRIGLFCSSCSCCFTTHLRDVRSFSEDEMVADYSYLVGQAKLRLANSTSKTHARFTGWRQCRCGPKPSGKDCEEPRPADAGLLLRVAADDLRNVSFQAERSQEFELNAYWCESDQCCYQPIVCTGSGCRPKGKARPAVIGYKLVAVGARHANRTDVLGQTWLFSKSVNHCQRFLSTKKDDGSSQ